MSEEIKDHYEELSCSHQNNLLLEYPDKSKNTEGVCPKGCDNITVLRVRKIDVRLAGTKKAQIPE